MNDDVLLPADLPLGPEGEEEAPPEPSEDDLPLGPEGEEEAPTEPSEDDLPLGPEDDEEVPSADEEKEIGSDAETVLSGLLEYLEQSETLEESDASAVLEWLEANYQPCKCAEYLETMAAPRPFFTLPFTEYTVTEGCALLLLLSLVISALFHMVRRFV